MMTPMPSGMVEFAQDFLQPLAFLLVFDLARNAALVGVGQQDQITARQHEVGRDARAFGADGPFGHLHDDVAARRIKARDVLLRDARLVALSGFAFDEFHAAVEVAGHDVPVMQEGVFLEADVHKRGLQAVLEIAHLALENAADQPLLGGAFDGEFLELAFFEHGHAGFERFGVDDDFLVRLLHRLDQPLDFFDDGGGRGADGFHDALRAAGEPGPARKAFPPGLPRASPGSARGNRLWRASPARFPRSGLGRAFRRQAGGDVFRALDFLRVPRAVIDLVLRRFVADGLGAGLGGVAVGAVGIGVQAAAGPEAHAAAAAPGKISITHILNKPFDRYRRFATCRWRSTSRALRTRHN